MNMRSEVLLLYARDTASTMCMDQLVLRDRSKLIWTTRIKAPKIRTQVIDLFGSAGFDSENRKLSLYFDRNNVVRTSYECVSGTVVSAS